MRFIRSVDRMASVASEEVDDVVGVGVWWVEAVDWMLRMRRRISTSSLLWFSCAVLVHLVSLNLSGFALIRTMYHDTLFFIHCIGLPQIFMPTQ